MHKKYCQIPELSNIFKIKESNVFYWHNITWHIHNASLHSYVKRRFVDLKGQLKL